MNPLRWKLHWQIVLGLGVGALMGWLAGSQSLAAAEASGGEAVAILKGRWDYMALDLAGDLFLQALKMIIVPLVTSSIIVAILGIGSGGAFGRLGLKTLLYYMATSLLAVLVGLTMVNLIKPGNPDAEQPLLTAEVTGRFADEAAELEAKTGGKTATSFIDVFREMVPENLFSAATDNGQLLGLIIISLLAGFFLTRMEGRSKEVVGDFFRGVNELFMRITDFVLRFAPLGVAGLLAATLSENYARLAADERLGELAVAIGKFSGTAVLALGIHFFLVMPVLLCVLARVNPLKHYKAMAPAILTAFSTASSSATLPVTMESLRENAGVSRQTTSFVLPLGATVNMDGTALYECVAAIFIAQAFGITLGFGEQFFVVVVALLTSVGVAGVPHASLVAIVVILKSLSGQLEAQGVHVPLESGLAILLIFDRFLDMCRTAVNVFSDSVGAVIVARSEGESGFYPARPLDPAAP
jgi:proton glutamate symport protein